MSLFRATAGRRTASWIAVLALVLQFAGGLLHGFAGIADAGMSEGRQLVVICTAQGVRAIAVDGNGQPLEQDGGPGAGHGAFCALCGCVTGTLAFAAAPATVPLPGDRTAGRACSLAPDARCMGREPDSRRGQDPPLRS
ncbi:MAG: DUF2946 family protein [Hyphomicrobiales bacterium]